MSIELRSTADGSHTLYNPQLDETYHSIHGAVQESMHVFIKAGLEYLLEIKKDLWVLEVGLGTGLNAWLTINSVLHSDAKIHYVGVEPFPVEQPMPPNDPRRVGLSQPAASFPEPVGVSGRV